MIHGLLAHPLSCGVITGALGVVLWVYKHHWQRFTSWCFAASAGCFMVAYPLLFDAFAALAASTIGVIFLSALVVFIGPAFHLQAVRTHKKTKAGTVYLWVKRKVFKMNGGSASRPDRHRRIATPVVSVLAGLMITFSVAGGWKILLDNAGTSAKGTVAALKNASRQLSNGKAAAALPVHDRLTTWVAIAIGVVVFAFVLRMIERRLTGGGKPKGGRGGQLPAGGGRPAIGA